MKRFVHTFFETIPEILSEVTGEWIPAGDRDGDIDQQINKFATVNPQIKIVDIKQSENTYAHATNPNARYHGLTYAVMYEAESAVAQYQPQKEVKPDPAATAPTLEALQIEAGRKTKVHMMCGIFCVREGSKLDNADEEPAPKPLFSPDLDLKSYADFFGNIKKD